METQDVFKQAETEIRRMKSQLKKVRAQIAKDKAETARLKAEYDEVKAKNDKMIKDLGWDVLTSDEYAWLQENYYKEWQFFKPSVEAIRARYAERTQQKYEPIPMDPKFVGFEEYQTMNGWLDPDGRYYPVKNFAEHDAWAWDYLNDKHGKMKAGEIISKAHGSATDVLQDQGWVRIMKWEGVPVNFVFQRKITNSQKDSLYLYCALHSVPLPFKKEEY